MFKLTGNPQIKERRKAAFHHEASQKLGTVFMTHSMGFQITSRQLTVMVVCKKQKEKKQQNSRLTFKTFRINLMFPNPTIAMSTEHQLQIWPQRGKLQEHTPPRKWVDSVT